MPVDNWGTPLRDVLAEADIRLELGEINPKLAGFLGSDGQPYKRPYDEIKDRIGERIAENRVETWKKLFQEMGLLWVDDGVLQLTRFGRIVAAAYGHAGREVEQERMKIAAAAVRVLGRQQLLNPTTKNRDYPADCDVLPYRAIWKAIERLKWLHWEELHRVLLRVMRNDDLDPALSRIEDARKEPDYDPQDAASAEKYLGLPVYGDADQATRRMTPWFSAAGFGGVLIDKEHTRGRRSFTPLGAVLIPKELAQEREWQDFGDSPRAWFAYLDEAIESDEPGSSEPPPETLTPAIGVNDQVLLNVQKLLTLDNASGILLIGPPGTGKSWYARQIAIRLTNGDGRRIREVQFHPSYQYEDFVEGYVPDADRGFRLVDRHLLEMVSLAASTSGPVVLVIDEFSRADPARVLGETMTYMESSLRGVPFYLPSGRRISIPPNLVFIATMNPEDRSVDEIDAAMERRWAKVSLHPDKEKLREFLENNAASGIVTRAAMELFIALQKHVEVGHAFFRSVKDEDSLQRLWDTQLRHLLWKRFRFDTDSLRDAEGLWSECLTRLKADQDLLAGQPEANLDAPGDDGPQTK